jgi:hypothetical protein
MVFSLFTSGILLFLQYIHEVLGLCAGMFINDRGGYVFVPPCVSLATYSKPENRTRSLTLVRLAVNLGFAGPALGGLIIMNITADYSG